MAKNEKIFTNYRLLNEDNLTMDETKMWLTKVTELPISIKMKFETPVHLSALTVWNYNASLDTSYCGVCLKQISNV